MSFLKIKKIIKITVYLLTLQFFKSKIMTPKILGNLYLIPTTLGDCVPSDVLPDCIKKIIEIVDYYIFENEKTGRKSIKLTNPAKVQADLKVSILNKHTEKKEHLEMLQPCLHGHNVGLMSEAGCPGIADPGAVIAKLAHEKGIKVVPLVGPSSIFLALMASGMNGQNFAFNGYIPIDKSEKKVTLKIFEKLSSEKNQTQIFMETPYRNNKMLEDILSALHPETRLCVATDITLETEFIKTLSIAEWKKTKIDLHNRPCIFVLHKL